MNSRILDLVLSLKITHEDQNPKMNIQDPEIRNKVRAALGEISASMTRIEAEKDLIKEVVKKLSDELVKIPLKGKIESLNVSVSAGIVLYETLRQRGL